MTLLSITDLSLNGLKLIERQHIKDRRGFLARLFCAQDLASIGWYKPIAQINHTLTTEPGAIRGMHYQRSPHAEMKLVSCIRGEVWDVAVDVRVDSPTFLHWHAEFLSRDNGRALLIPEGFAHGFQALTKNVELLYCHSTAYNSGFEAGLNPCDPSLAIAWPLAISEISIRDTNFPFIENRFQGEQL